MPKFNNEAREQRKQNLEKQLFEIKIDELVEASLYPDSWFRQNLNLAPETSSFWTCLPRYVLDCHKAPSFVSAVETQIYIQQAIQKYSREYK